MCDELQEELDHGSSLAKQLVEHLLSMGASSCQIPVVLSSQDANDGKEFVVEIKPKP